MNILFLADIFQLCNGFSTKEVTNLLQSEFRAYLPKLSNLGSQQVLDSHTGREGLNFQILFPQDIILESYASSYRTALAHQDFSSGGKLKCSNLSACFINTSSNLAFKHAVLNSNFLNNSNIFGTAKLRTVLIVEILVVGE